MNTRFLTGIIGAAMVLSPLTFAQDNQKPSPLSRSRTAERKGSGISEEVRQENRSGVGEDVREAIAWERAKDRAAARQERMDGRHNSRGLKADSTAARTVDDSNAGSTVKDTKAPGAKREQ